MQKWLREFFRKFNVRSTNTKNYLEAFLIENRIDSPSKLAQTYPDVQSFIKALRMFAREGQYDLRGVLTVARRLWRYVAGRSATSDASADAADMGPPGSGVQRTVTGLAPKDATQLAIRQRLQDEDVKELFNEQVSMQTTRPTTQRVARVFSDTPMTETEGLVKQLMVWGIQLQVMNWRGVPRNFRELRNYKAISSVAALLVEHAGAIFDAARSYFATSEINPVDVFHKRFLGPDAFDSPYYFEPHEYVIEPPTPRGVNALGNSLYHNEKTKNGIMQLGQRLFTNKKLFKKIEEFAREDVKDNQYLFRVNNILQAIATGWNGGNVPDGQEDDIAAIHDAAFVHLTLLVMAERRRMDDRLKNDTRAARDGNGNIIFDTDTEAQRASGANSSTTNPSNLTAREAATQPGNPVQLSETEKTVNRAAERKLQGLRQMEKLYEALMGEKKPEPNLGGGDDESKEDKDEDAEDEDSPGDGQGLDDKSAGGRDEAKAGSKKQRRGFREEGFIPAQVQTVPGLFETPQSATLNKFGRLTELTNELRAFLPIAGSDAFIPPPGTDVQKARNQALYEARPAGWPVGDVHSNPLVASNVVQEGFRWHSPVNPLPPTFPGGDLNLGTQTHGTYRGIPAGIQRIATEATAANAVRDRAVVIDPLLEVSAGVRAAATALQADPGWRNANQSASSAEISAEHNNIMPLDVSRWPVHEQTTAPMPMQETLMPAQAFTKSTQIGVEQVPVPTHTPANVRTMPIYNPFQNQWN